MQLLKLWGSSSFKNSIVNITISYSFSKCIHDAVKKHTGFAYDAGVTSTLL